MSYIYDFSAWKKKPTKSAAKKSASKTISGTKKNKVVEKVVYEGIDLTEFYTNKPPYLVQSGEENAKLGKNKRISYIMYLAPAQFSKLKDQSGKRVDMCPYATTGCKVLCLNESGNAVRAKSKITARNRRVAFYTYDKERFLEQLSDEIHKFAAMHRRNVEETAFRLNGTSDLPFVWDLLERGLLDGLPKNVVFYDYTKNPLGWGVFPIGNTGLKYYVAFSRSEENDSICDKVLKAGGIVAVSFTNYKKQTQWLSQWKPELNFNYGNWKVPYKWHGYKVLNGDQSDDMMIDLYKNEFEVISNDWEVKGVSKGNGLVLGLHYKESKSLEEGTFGQYKSKVDKATKFQIEKANSFLVKCDESDDCDETKP